MRSQPAGGHIFNIDGAGADGNPTPQYAAYGATKAGEHHSLLFALDACQSKLPIPPIRQAFDDVLLRSKYLSWILHASTVCSYTGISIVLPKLVTYNFIL